MRGRYFLVGSAVVGCGVLGLTGCSDDTDTNDATPATTAAPSLTTSGPTTTAGTATSTTGTGTMSGDSAPVANALAALDTATGAAPDGKPFDLETDMRGADVVFDTKVAAGGNEIKVVVDATGHRIVSQQQSQEPSDDIAKLTDASVSAADALRTAGSREPDASVDQLEIDTDAGGAVVWQVDLVRSDHSEITYT
ncbi:MAG: hypothetical protein ACRD0P_28960, partial [Stackebrandtia sp.]